jgi:hypothetical protein
MGGLVSRLMVTDAGMTFWNQYFAKPPDQVPMDAKDKRILEKAIIFEHRPNVSRVIFFTYKLWITIEQCMCGQPAPFAVIRREKGGVDDNHLAK